MYDNRITIEDFFGAELEIEGSLGACAIYANRFADALKEPYTGDLLADIIQLYMLAEGGESSKNHIDYEGLVRIVWAMAAAAGSTKVDYDKFIERIQHATVNLYELARIYNAVVHDLGDRVFFRLPEGQDDAGQSDTDEEGQELSSDGGERDVE